MIDSQPEEIELVIEQPKNKNKNTENECHDDRIMMPVERINEVDAKRSIYASTKNAAEGMMDIALLTANANQLRFLITYNKESQTFLISVILIITSLLLQILVGFAIIFKRQMKNKGKRVRAKKTNDYLVGGVFLITIINVFVASFTITEKNII